MKAIKEIKSGKRKKRFKKKLKKKHKKLNSKMLKKSEKPNSTLPDIQGYKEYNLERDVKCWSDDSRNKVLISALQCKDNIFQVKVAVVLEGVIIQSMIEYTENVEESIEKLCGDIHLLLSNKDRYKSPF